MYVCINVRKDEGDELEEEDLDAANVKRKSRRSSRRVDHTVPDSVTSRLVVFHAALQLHRGLSGLTLSTPCLFLCTFPGTFSGLLFFYSIFFFLVHVVIFLFSKVSVSELLPVPRERKRFPVCK